MPQNSDSMLDYRSIGPPVDDRAAGLRLDVYLAEHYKFLSRSAWQFRIRQGLIKVGDRVVRPAYRLRAGDHFHLWSPPQEEPDVDRGIERLWQEGSIMAVYKPGNLPMHENGPYRKNTFTHLVWQMFGRQWAAVHRLDRETSGIVLCGDNLSVRQSLSRALAARDVEKVYLAIVHGQVKTRQWQEYRPLGDAVDSKIRIKKWVVDTDAPDAQTAETQFRTLAICEGASLLEVRPKTGRTHQIRIHAAVQGHHLVGDKVYHPDEDVFLEYFDQGNTANVQAAVGSERLCLHAFRLSFTDPTRGILQRVEAPVPEDMKAVWNRMRQNGLIWVDPDAELDW